MRAEVNAYDEESDDDIDGFSEEDYQARTKRINDLRWQASQLEERSRLLTPEINSSERYGTVS